jgi:hypothetical protein
VLDGAYCVRELDRTTRRVLTLLIHVLPVAVIANIIGYTMPDCVRKPTSAGMQCFGFTFIFFFCYCGFS